MSSSSSSSLCCVPLTVCFSWLLPGLASLLGPAEEAGVDAPPLPRFLALRDVDVDVFDGPLWELLALEVACSTADMAASCAAAMTEFAAMSAVKAAPKVRDRS
jgi:hypothetical protein